MPEYEAVARNGKPHFVGDDAINAQKWLKKHNYKWLVVNIELAAEDKDPKTDAQRGYYFGLLLPEITRELVHQGHTEKIEFTAGKHKIKREIPIRKKTVHEEVITPLCGRIGTNGAPMRLSDCDKEHAQKFIENVLNFAGELGMNTKRLEALQVPEL